MMASASAGSANSRRWIRTESRSSSPISARHRRSYAASAGASKFPAATASAAVRPACSPVTMA
jgi:hypothetical protein